MMKNKKLEIGFMRHNTDNPAESQNIVDYAIEHGQPYFETCYFYLDGKCEDFIYSLLKKYNRNEYQLCGKAPIHSIVETMGIENLFQQQLAKVPGGYFDIYLLQALDTKAAFILKEQNIIPYLLKQKQLGYIKKFGLSIQCTPETFEQYLKLNCWDIVQMPLNYYDWFVCRANELYNLACKYNLPIIAQAPMKGGLLQQAEINNPTKFALDFVSNLDQVEYILTGCSQLKSYEDTYLNINSFNVDISFETYKNILQSLLNKTKINCINCNQCYRECTAQIPIPVLFNLYNKCLNLNDEYHNIYFTDLNSLKKCIGEPTHICTYCNKCLAVCPTKLKITKLFRDNIFEIRT